MSNPVQQCTENLAYLTWRGLRLQYWIAVRSCANEGCRNTPSGLNLRGVSCQSSLAHVLRSYPDLILLLRYSLKVEQELALERSRNLHHKSLKTQSSHQKMSAPEGSEMGLAAIKELSTGKTKVSLVIESWICSVLTILFRLPARQLVKERLDLNIALDVFGAVYRKD